jgi:hypothetical protein
MLEIFPRWRGDSGRWPRFRQTRGALIAGTGLFLLAPQAGAAILKLNCTNPASGTSWQLVVDLDRNLVDSMPATISQKSISWQDSQRRLYDFDRATGRLEMRNASSTGGYALSYTCRSE